MGGNDDLDARAVGEEKGIYGRKMADGKSQVSKVRECDYTASLKEG